jgi:hypothetical protein
MKTLGEWMYRSTFSGTSWRWVVIFTPRPVYPRGKSAWYPLYRRLGGPQSRSGRRGEEKFFDATGTQLRPLGRPSLSQSLYRLRYSGSPHQLSCRCKVCCKHQAVIRHWVTVVLTELTDITYLPPYLIMNENTIYKAQLAMELIIRYQAKRQINKWNYRGWLEFEWNRRPRVFLRKSNVCLYAGWSLTLDVKSVRRSFNK